MWDKNTSVYNLPNFFVKIKILFVNPSFKSLQKVSDLQWTLDQ